MGENGRRASEEKGGREEGGRDEGGMREMTIGEGLQH